MTCMQCGAAMKTKRENVRYDESGLPITLIGVNVSRCSSCGEYEVAIPRIEELHRTIALMLIQKETRLMPAEIRFLRTYADWTGVELAKQLGVSPETMSRWEHGTTAMGPVADRLLRAMILLGMRNEKEPLALLGRAARACNEVIRET